MASELINIPGSSIYYYVDVEKGIVIAKMDNVYSEMSSTFEKLKRSVNEEGRGIMKLVFRNMEIPITLKGKATCSENDEFDLDFGMKLARDRLLRKYYKIMTNVFVAMNNHTEDFLEALDSFIIKSMVNFNKFDRRSSFNLTEEDSEVGAPAEVESQVEIDLNKAIDEMENSNI